MHIITKLVVLASSAMLGSVVYAQCQNVPMDQINDCFQRQQLQRDVGRMVQDINRQNQFPNSQWANPPQPQRQCVRDVWGNIQCNQSVNNDQLLKKLTSLNANMNKFIVVIPLLLLSACSSTKWTHRSNTEQQFYMDRASCSNESQRNTPSTAAPYNPYLDPMQQANQNMYNAGANAGRAFGVQQYFETCMYARGYVKNQKSKSSKSELENPVFCFLFLGVFFD